MHFILLRAPGSYIVMLWLMIGRVDAPIHQESLTGATAAVARITCWCVVCAQDPLGSHAQDIAIWQGTILTVFIVAVQQLGMSDEF